MFVQDKVDLYCTFHTVEVTQGAVRIRKRKKYSCCYEDGWDKTIFYMLLYFISRTHNPNNTLNAILTIKLIIDAKCKRPKYSMNVVSIENVSGTI